MILKNLTDRQLELIKITMYFIFSLSFIAVCFFLFWYSNQIMTDPCALCKCPDVWSVKL